MAVDRPTLPKTLTDEAAAEWRRIVPDLDKLGLLAKIDRGVLIRYCTAWADWVEIDENLRKTGKLIKGRRDGLIRNPLWLLRRDAEMTLSDLGRQLGLTPSARDGMKKEEQVKAKPDGDSDKITELRSRRTNRGAHLVEAPA